MLNEKHRIYGKTKHIEIDKLKELLQDKRLDYIKLVLLFGSRSKNEQNIKSDYDFAVIFDKNRSYKWGAISKAWSDIGKILGLADYDYDVVDLAVADKILISSIMESYVILKGDKNELSKIFREYNSSSK
jgi:predicted nucleotidyltransferase